MGRSDHDHDHDTGTGSGSDDGTAATTRSEEVVRAQRVEHEAGRVRVRKSIEEDSIDESFDRGIEHADTERVGAHEHDSGEIETLPDGSVSVPVFEEELVVTKRLVVRERIVIRKEVVTEQQRITADLKRERVEIDVDEHLDDVVEVDDREEILHTGEVDDRR